MTFRIPPTKFFNLFEILFLELHRTTRHIWFRFASPKLLRNFRYAETFGAIARVSLPRSARSGTLALRRRSAPAGCAEWAAVPSSSAVARLPRCGGALARDNAELSDMRHPAVSRLRSGSHGTIAYPPPIIFNCSGALTSKRFKYKITSR